MYVYVVMAEAQEYEEPLKEWESTGAVPKRGDLLVNLKKPEAILSLENKISSVKSYVRDILRTGDGESVKLKSFFESIREMEEDYLKSKFVSISNPIHGRKKNVDINISDTNSATNESDENEWKMIEDKRQRKLRKVKVNTNKNGNVKSRKYTTEGSSEMDESSDNSVDYKYNVFMQDFHAMRENGVSSNDAGWAVLIAIESEKLSLLKGRDKRERIKASKPWPYGLDGVQKINDFLDDFERYAREQFGSDRNRWAVELRNFLDGQARRVYFSIYKPGMKYEKIVSRIKQWCNEENKNEKLTSQREFWTASMKDGEKLGEYALRLQTLYETAVPVNERDKQALKAQFLSSIPSYVARRFKMRMGKDIEGRSLRWRDLVHMALDDDDNELTNMAFNKQEPAPLPVWAFTQDGPLQGMANPKLATYSETFKQNRYSKIPRTNVNADTQQRIVKCKYCKKANHVMKDCWKMKGFCLVCGSNAHRASECEKRRVIHEASNMRKNILCYGCGESGHRAVNCPVIVQTKKNNRIVKTENNNESISQQNKTLN